MRAASRAAIWPLRLGGKLDPALPPLVLNEAILERVGRAGRLRLSSRLVGRLAARTDQCRDDPPRLRRRLSSGRRGWARRVRGRCALGDLVMARRRAADRPGDAVRSGHRQRGAAAHPRRSLSLGRVARLARPRSGAGGAGSSRDDTARLSPRSWHGADQPWNLAFWLAVMGRPQSLDAGLVGALTVAGAVILGAGAWVLVLCVIVVRLRLRLADRLWGRLWRLVADGLTGILMLGFAAQQLRLLVG